MFRIIYAVERECKPEGFEDNLVFAEGEYEMMLFENDTMIEVDYLPEFSGMGAVHGNSGCMQTAAKGSPDAGFSRSGRKSADSGSASAGISSDRCWKSGYGIWMVLRGRGGKMQGYKLNVK